MDGDKGKYLFMFYGVQEEDYTYVLNPRDQGEPKFGFIITSSPYLSRPI